MINSIYLEKILKCRRLFLKNYSVLMKIGIYNNEKFKKQLVVINVDLYILLSSSTPQNDQIAEVIDYNFIYETIQKCVNVKHINLQETLCDNITNIIFEHPKIYGVRVSIEKPHAFTDCKSVGVEIFKFKD